MSKFENLPALPEEIDEAKWKKAKALLRTKKKSGLAKLLVQTKKRYGTLAGQKPHAEILDFYENLFDIYEGLEIGEKQILKMQYHVKSHKELSEKIKKYFIAECLDEIVKTCDTLLQEHGQSKVARLTQKSMLAYLKKLKEETEKMKTEFPAEEDFAKYEEDVETLQEQILNSTSLLKHAMGDMSAFLKVQSKNRMGKVKENFVVLKTLKDSGPRDRVEPLVKAISLEIHHIFRGGGLQLRQYHPNKLSKPEILQVLEDSGIEVEAQRLYNIADLLKRGASSSYLHTLCLTDLEKEDFHAVFGIVDTEVNEAIDFLRGIIALMRDVKGVYDRL